MKRQTSNPEDCRILNIPSNGRVVLSADPAHRLNFYDVISNFDSVQYTCNTNHYISGNVKKFCVNGDWTNPVPDCEPKCDIRAISSISHVAHCSRTAYGVSEIVLRCGRNDLVDPGTEARIVCQGGYQSTTPHEQVTMCRDEKSGWMWFGKVER